MHNVICPFCGGDEADCISRYGKYQKECYTSICRICGGVYNKIQPDESELIQRYSENYWDEYSDTCQREAPIEDSLSRMRYNWLESFFPSKRRVIEIGYGEGNFLYTLSQRNSNLELAGVDPAYQFDSAIKAKAPDVHLVSNLSELSQNSYDLICMFHVLEHFSLPDSILSTVHAMLADGGIVAIEVPDVYKPHWLGLDYFFRDVHLVNFSKNTLSFCLQRNGFTIVELGSCGAAGENLNVIAEKSTKSDSSPDFPLDDCDRLSSFLHRYNRLPETPYYLYGSGQGVKSMLEMIGNHGALLPEACLDKEPSFPFVNTIPLIGIESGDYNPELPIVLGTFVYQREMTEKIIAIHPLGPEAKIIDLAVK